MVIHWNHKVAQMEKSDILIRLYRKTLKMLVQQRAYTEEKIFTLSTN